MDDSPICKQDSASYEASFTRNGGQNLYEELESVCNDYAKKLNKQRKNLKGKFHLFKTNIKFCQLRFKKE